MLIDLTPSVSLNTSLPKEYLDKAKAAARRQRVGAYKVGGVEAKLVSLVGGGSVIINRPGVAGAVLHKALLLID